MKAIVFDFGNVVGFFDHFKTLRRLEQYTKMPAETIYSSIYAGQLEDDFESGRISEEQFLTSFIRLCQLSCQPPQLSDLCADIFWPNPEVCDLVPKLKPAYRLLLGSNTNVIHARFFKQQFAEVLGHFDALVLSYEIGVRKPSAAFFQHCQKVAEAAPHECLFIDDLPDNVAAARQLGWHGIVYRPGNDLARALRAHDVQI
jgi:glucose-1-phosphatase